MKKTLILAVVGLAVGSATTYGQGFVIESSWQTPVNGLGQLFGTTTPIPAGYTADLYYSFGTVSDTVDNNSVASITALPTGLTDSGFTVSFATGAADPGYFDGGTVAIPGYTASTGAITFEIVAYNGASYATSTVRGRTGTFTMASIATGVGVPPALGDLGLGSGNFPNYFVANAVPEPSTLALAGLGLAALVAYRRKQA